MELAARRMNQLFSALRYSTSHTLAVLLDDFEKLLDHVRMLRSHVEPLGRIKRQIEQKWRVTGTFGFVSPAAGLIVLR